ncbi:hypothetical protein [Paenibacillus xylanexedens]|uniref:NOL1/NOP2/fmu family ribosome biogenesis protein n=1 Tax=Paenibacillus xylanexedens TaxID=528191 RepID=A0ABS4RND8_PAEXY|nr:hypothetical protein [Paenibacillus xylanexedens]MBP2243870.1 NOL1/NOP2/fmu family ribosome biogenesis protein [Paenibacillus xylanexedens]
MTTKVKEQIEEPEENSKPTKLKTCFIVMPISNADGYDLGHFDRVYEYIIKPACKAVGFEPSRADDTKHTNTIILDILNQIVQADMVICDLSSKNPNVMYELGIRQAFNLPVVLIKDDITNRIFDTASLRDIEYDHNLRIDTVKAAVDGISESLKETYRRRESDTHSLISLLKIKPATVPEEIEISSETALILEKIKQLNKDVNINRTGLTIDNWNESGSRYRINAMRKASAYLNTFSSILPINVNHEDYGRGVVIEFSENTQAVIVNFENEDPQLIPFPYEELTIEGDKSDEWE